MYVCVCVCVCVHILSNGYLSIIVLTAAPRDAPTNFQSEILTSEEPYRYTFTWGLSYSGPSIHSGFVIHCYPNASSPNITMISVSHAVFSDREGRDFSATVAMPGSCSSPVLIYFCSIAAFNERGEGPSSETVTVYLPCVAESESVSMWCKNYITALLLSNLTAHECHVRIFENAHARMGTHTRKYS